MQEPYPDPKPSGDVTIHDPTVSAGSPSTGQMPTTPIVFKDSFWITLTLVFAASVLLFLAAYISGQIFRAEPGRVEIPVLLQAVTAILVAIPCTKIGYTVMRTRARTI